MEREEESNRRRRLAIPLVLSGGVALLGLAAIGGVFANFTQTAGAGPEPVSTGQVEITLGTPTGDHGSVTVGPITNMAEGDSIARVVQLTNNSTIGTAGTTGLAATNGLVLQTAVSGTNAGSNIVTDATNGLHVTVQSCATAPVESGGTAGPWTYTCSGGFTTAINNVALATLNSSPVDMTSAAPIEGSSSYLVVTVALPTTYADSYAYNGGVCSTGGAAGSTEQLMNCSLSVTYNFTATQRAGSAQ